MTEQMLREGFGNCGNHYECQAACPKGIKVSFIAKLNREFIKARVTGKGCQSNPGKRKHLFRNSI
jgi:succinate dehydrogenase / fumarate reductase iron-sulfur subunit